MKTRAYNANADRLDAEMTCDGQQVVCPNASRTGYGTSIAKPGSWITWQYETGGNVWHGRVLARVTWLSEDRMKGHKELLLVLTLSTGANHLYERFVEPGDVTECYANPPADVFEFISRPKLPHWKDVLRMSRYGSLGHTFDPAYPRIGEAEARLEERKKAGRPDSW